MSESARPDTLLRVDLHTHSTASDGLYAPAELVRLAREAGLDLIALVDHDTTQGVAEAQAAGKALGLTVMPGVEINTDITGGGEAHILGYELSPDDPSLARNLGLLRGARERRGERMVRNLRAAGFDITWERVRELARGAVGRPHVARALIEGGYASDVSDAFARYLSPGRAGFSPRYKLSPENAIRIIRAARGVATLAHPAGIADLETRVLPTLIEAGLQGLECYYGQYDDATVARLLDLARRFDLIATGGSDYHGPNMHPTPLGGRAVPPGVVAALRAAREAALARPDEPFALAPPTL
ncbi:MAG: PHP domain-containing protein [Chloroflexota bacterium]|nr:PHP domain-containing protein [Chloroflexota bacterium]